MKSRKLVLLGTLLSFSLFSGAMGCGEGASSSSPDPSASPTLLTLAPSGPVSIKKGQTVNFDTNLAEASFSVVGGASNGSIDAEGIYTAPATLPSNTQVTVQATLDSQTASAIVNLATADTVSISATSRKKISDVAIHPLALLSMDSQLNFSRTRLAVSDSSTHQVAALWTNYDGTNANGSFDLMTNFGLFGSDHAPLAPVDSIFSGSIGFGTDGTLHIIQMEQSAGKYGLKHYATSNGGSSYVSNPVHFDAAMHAFSPSLSIDANNTLHVIFIKGASPMSSQKLLYMKSSDEGATWSSPLEINMASVNVKLQPQLTTNASGNEIDLCWLEVSGAQTDVYYARSANSGSSFAAAVPLTSSPALKEGQCQVKRGGAGESYVLYSGLFITATIENMEVFIAKTTDGSSFAAPVQVNSDSYHRQILPFMSVDSLGRIDVIWTWDQDGDGSDIPEKIYHARSTDSGNTFSTNDLFVADAAGQAVVPMGLVHDTAGRLHMSYVQREAGNLHLFYQMAE